MATVTGFSLRSIAHNVVRCGILPSGDSIKVGEEVITISGEGIGCNGDVTQKHIFIRPLLGRIGVKAYLEGHLGRICPEGGHALFDYNVAIVTALVRPGDMAHVAVHFIAMDNVMLYAVFTPFNIGVAIQAGRHGFAVITVGILGPIPMESGHRVALEAVHPGFFPVHTARDPFVQAHVFSSNPCTMAGKACILNGYDLLNPVTFEKAPSGKDGTANMAVSAIGMAVSTVVLVGLLHVGIREVRPTGFKNRYVTLERFMKRCFSSSGNIAVAGSAFIGGILDYTFVSFFLILSSGHPSMAANTIVRVVHILQKALIY